MVEIKPINFDELPEFSLNLKAADVLEIKASYSCKNLDAIEDTISNSDEAHAFYEDGQLIGVFGVEGRSNGAVVWMVSTDAISDCGLSFYKQAMNVVSAWSAKYGLLWNYVYSGNTKSLKWLEHLGFVKHATVESYGAHNAPYFCMVLNPIEAGG
ncbi:phage protein Gp13 family protein [Aeromonas veronii]|uniref:phage protein Gp13 family protein n=1 Tax=Aeromonas veronii TaxID=654 RepID=UPI003BA1EBD8